MTDPRLLDMEWLLDPSILGLALWICQTLLFGLMLLPDPGTWIWRGCQAQVAWVWRGSHTHVAWV
jgi:hypothetical protein